MSHPLIHILSPTLLTAKQAEVLLEREALSTEQLLYRVSQVSGHSQADISKFLANQHQLHYEPQPTQQFELTKVMAIIIELKLEPITLTQPLIPIALSKHGLQLLSYDPCLKTLALELQFHHNLPTQLILTDLEQFQFLQQKVHSELKDHHNSNEHASLLFEVMQISLQRNASDIHIEPDKEQARIRMRCDGLLISVMTLSNREIKALISQIKINAELDIAEQRLPQDGRMHYSLSEEQSIELRVATLPTLWGEKLVMRLANNTQALPTLNQLGMNQAQHALLEQELHQPQGLILVTGPTGSGKTITLYSCLNNIANDNINICTVEDPVEIHLAGFNQIQVNANIALTFAKCLRSLLRQDPDVIMLGEIRDQETAEMAIQAAQTGHLVLSTLHTNSAFSALDRLYQLGIHPPDLQSSLRLVIAQRLLRKSCPYCAKFAENSGCFQCNQGYKGRVGIFELLPINRELLQQVTQPSFNAQQITANLVSQQDLKACATQLLKQGLTTTQELQRVLGHG
ncbi:GspE/PulE family protein [Vibrio neonatus]|uniref:GspE/PulE family protein n=1 Tax=Vibrio neonatus TaxID=278860 RepID=UPI0021C4B061|nr:GspE/PulE family protein [Vibrio neonatus]